jgi:hypothetical protein
MKSLVSMLVGVGVASVLSACAANVPPSAKAAEVERMQCSHGTNARDDIQLLQATTVLQAEPIYSHIHTNTNEEERVSGAKLLIRPPEGISADRLAGVLQCHSARLLLGQIDRSQIPDDPYWLPDAWLDINVTPEGGNLAVTLRADTVTKNLAVLSRATAFADTHHFAETP